MPDNCSCASAQEIRGEMAAIRSHLDSEVGGIVLNARRLADWRHYVRAFPLCSVLAAAAVGYLAIPRRKRVPDASSKLKIATEGAAITVEPNKSWTSSLGGMAANLVIRSAVSYATEQIKRQFQKGYASRNTASACRRTP